jgi:FkbM family methyltransferase
MEKHASLTRMVLPNGLAIMHDRASQDTKYVYREVFEERVYLQHGVALHDGATVMDVGGHIGFFSLYALTSHARINIYACEPMPRTFAALSHNLNAHVPEGSKVRSLNVGISDVPRTVEFSYYPSVPGHSTMFPEGKAAVQGVLAKDVAEHTWKHSKLLSVLCILLFPFRRALQRAALRHFFRDIQVSVQLKRLSDVIDEEQIASIDLLKIDVEDAELEVLRSIRADHWPRIRQVAVELGGDPAVLAAVETLLREQGFVCNTVHDPVALDVDGYILFATRATDAGRSTHEAATR